MGNNHTKHHAAFFLITFVQCLLIFFLGMQLLQKYGIASSNKLNVSPIEKDKIIIPEDSGFKYYSELVPSNVITKKRDWDGKIVKYQTNSDGLNETAEYQIIKPDNTYRIVVLGDSFTYGANVNTDSNWTELLETKLNQNLDCPKYKKAEVINLGMEGFDIPYITKRYKDFGKKYNPDTILWFESGTGFRRDMEITKPLIEACVAKFPTDYTLTPDEYWGCWEEANNLMLEGKTSKNYKEELETWIKYFLSLRGETQLIFATFNTTPEKDKDVLRSYVRDYVNVIFTDEVSDIKSNNNVFPDDHPSEEGHEMISDDLSLYLAKNKELLMKCN